MAKAIASCTCSICGNKFQRTKTCPNRTDANRWTEWAINFFTTCPSCYGKQMREQEIEKGLYFDVYVDIERAVLTESQHIAIVFGGDTMPHKEQIKELGARWTNNYPDAQPLGNFLSMRPREHRWTLWCALNNAEKYVDLAESIGAKCNQIPTENSFAMLRRILSDKEKKKVELEERVKKEMETIGEKPQWDDDIRALWKEGERWNGVCYGKRGHYKIYLSGREVSLTDEQKESMERTYAARQAWESKKETIEQEVKEKMR